MGKYYAVFKGRNEGVYNTWEECKKEVNGYKGSDYKAFTTKKEAIEAIRSKGLKVKNTRPAPRKSQSTKRKKQIKSKTQTQTKKATKVYTEAERQLNIYIRANFPEWECKDIQQMKKEPKVKQTIVEKSKPKTKPKPTSAKKVKQQQESVISVMPTFGLSVDGACAGNPGRGEYQCVDIETKDVIFSSSKFEYTTNNLMEFFALVEVIKYRIDKKLNTPIYTDSIVAMSWVKNRKTKTGLRKVEENFDTFALIEKHEEYLRSIKGHIKIEKWHTSIWGEIPADFGRKK